MKPQYRIIYPNDPEAQKHVITMLKAVEAIGKGCSNTELTGIDWAIEGDKKIIDFEI